MSREKKPSIQEVSRLSGVSVATVSRVIHQNGRFSAETERRVREVMEQLHYRPDSIAQGMRMRTMPIAGIIVPDILDERYGQMVRTAQQTLFTNGYSAVVFNSNESGAQTQRFIDSMESQHAGGLIYVPDSRETQVSLRGIPTVFFEREPDFEPDAAHIQICMNDFDSARTAMQRLLDDGLKRIVLLGSSMPISTMQHRMEGALEKLKDAGLEPAAILRVDPQRTSEAVTAMEQLMQSGTDFDAVFSISQRLTVGALKVLNDSQSRKPVLGMGQLRLHRYGLLDYLAVREPIDDMACAAAEAVIQLMKGESSLPSRQVYRTEWAAVK